MNNVKKSKRIILPLFIVIISLFMGIGYAKVNDIQLNLFGIAEANIPEELMIIDVNSNNDSNIIITNYDKTLLNSKIILDDSDINSNKTLEITLYNNTKSKQYFDEVKYQDGNITYDNSNIDFSINGLQEGTSIESKQSLTFTVTFKYSDSYKNEIATNIPDKLDNELNSILNFYFGYFVKFYQGEGDIKPDNYFLSSNNTLHEIETEIPKREGYTFMGWYDNIDYTKGQMFYDEEQNPIALNNLILENFEVTLYPGWKPIEYTIEYYENTINSNYTGVEYIETINNSFIDTGVTNLNEDFSFEITFSIDSNTNWVMGSVYSSGNIADLGISKNAIRFGTNYVTNIPFEYNKKYKVYVDKDGYSINDIFTPWVQPSLLKIDSKSIYLFWANGSSVGKGGRIYNVKFYYNGTLTNEYIPCKNNLLNSYGMLDIKNNMFFNGDYNYGEIVSTYKKVFSQKLQYDEINYIKDYQVISDRYKFSNWNTSEDGTGTSYIVNQEIINLSEIDGDVIKLYVQLEKDYSLPNSYKKVTYLESNGSQYIDTGLTMNNEMSIEVIFEFNEYNAWMLGKVETYGQKNDFGISKNAIRFGTSYITTLSFNMNQIYKVFIDKNGYSINNISATWNSTAQLSTAPKTVYLFWANGSSAGKGGKIYNVKFYNNGNLINEFVPCYHIDDNKTGMYDLVERKFYTSVNKDEFILGPEVTE